MVDDRTRDEPTSCKTKPLRSTFECTQGRQCECIGWNQTPATMEQRSACRVIQNSEEVTTSTPEFSCHRANTSKLVVEGKRRHCRSRNGHRLYRATSKDTLHNGSQPRHHQQVEHRVQNAERNRWDDPLVPSHEGAPPTSLERVWLGFSKPTGRCDASAIADRRATHVAHSARETDVDSTLASIPSA